MANGDGLAESRLRSDANLNKESRIFFGDKSSRPSYSGDSYGAPSAGYGAPVYNPSYNQNLNPVSLNPPFYYDGYYDDLYLLIKLGQVALIIFIILAIFIIFAMIIMCCVSMFKRGKKDRGAKAPQPYIIQSQVDSGKGGPLGGGGGGVVSGVPSGGGGGLARTPGVTNLTLEMDTPTSEDGGRSPKRRSPGRARGRSRTRERDSTTGMSETSSVSTSLPPHPGQQQQQQQQLPAVPLPTWGLQNRPEQSRPWGPEPPVTTSDSSERAGRHSSLNRSEISKNRSIGYYEVPMATTVSTFTYLPPTAASSTPPTTSPPQPPYTGGRYAVASRRDQPI